MKVWVASFALTQRWLGFVLLAGLLAIAVERRLDQFGLLDDVRSRLGFVPDYLDIRSPLRRLGVALVAIWIPLSIAFTIARRTRIHLENHVGPKR